MGFRETAPGVPVIPLRLAARPVVGGLAVPWVAAHHKDGTPVLGFLDAARQVACLTGCQCQACGQPLESPLIMFARARDVLAGFVAEPALHPECAAYSAASCPMLAGTMARYRSVPRPSRQERCADDSCDCRAWIRSADRELRAGQPREPFAAVWISRSEYRVTRGEADGTPTGLALGGVPVLKVRPVPPGPPDKWAVLAATGRRGMPLPPEVAIVATLDLVSLVRRAESAGNGGCVPGKGECPERGVG